MHISLLTTDYLPNIGGVAQHIYELSKALVRAGNRVEVIAPLFSKTLSWINLPAFSEHQDGISIWRVPLCLNRSIPFITGQITGRLSKQKFTAQAIARFVSTKPDVLHWHALDTYGYPVEKFSGIKVWTNHTSNFIEGIQTPSGLSHYQREASSADEIICPSKELADLTIKIGIPRKRVHFISNGVDAHRFHPNVDSSKWRKKLTLTEDDLLILCPRRLEIKNGVRYFVQAAISLLKKSNISSLHFAIAGDFTGPKADSDEAIVTTLIRESQCKNRIHLLGRVENLEMPSLYSAADVIVMPSLIEATSLSALEAMATAKPIVSTNVGGLPFLVHNEKTGILVEPQASEQIATAIEQLAIHPELRLQWGHNARKRIETEFDWSVIAKKVYEIYQLAQETRLENKNVKT